MFTDSFGRTHRYAPPAGYDPFKPFNLNATADWVRIVAQGLTFEPYQGPTSLVTSVRGDCLEPLVVEGRHALQVRPVAPDEALIDGDLYLVAWANADEVKVYTDAKGIASTDRFLIAKFLRYTPFGWFVQCRDSFAELNGEVVFKVVGVVPVTEVNLGQLAPNAVTDISTNTSGASVTCSTGAANTLIDTTVISQAVTTTGGLVEVDVGCMVSLAGAAGAIASVANLSVYRDGSPVTNGMKYDPTLGGSVTLSGSSPIVGQVSLTVLDAPPAGVHTYTLHAQFERTTSTVFGMTCSNNFIKVMEIRK
jgi:hypothetical protein